MAEQMTFLSWSCVAPMPPTQYVKGESRYMNIQKPGRADGDCITPQNVSIIENRRMTMGLAVCVSGIAAITMWAKVLA